MLPLVVCPQIPRAAREAWQVHVIPLRDIDVGACVHVDGSHGWEWVSGLTCLHKNSQNGLLR